MIGGSGNDRLIGGQGNDRLSGGGGRNRFIYHATDERVDQIIDFNVRLDAIDVSAILNTPAYRADDRFASYLRVSQSGADTIVRIDANGDSQGGLTRLAILENVSSNLSAQNFVVE